MSARTERVSCLWMIHKKLSSRSVVNAACILFASCSLLLVTCDNREGTPIDRFTLVTHHNVVIHEPDSLGSLSVGNGEFAFTVDVSGLQSFPAFYENGIPLGTQSQWAWHAFPNNN